MAQYNLGQNRLGNTLPLALTLLLSIPDLPRFDPAASTEWTLLDNANAILRAGEGPLASLPRAERVVALAPVGRLLFIETTLPPVAPAKRDALLRYAIEDKLTIDPSTVHAVVLGKSVTQQHVVAAIDRTWLVGVLAWLKQAGLSPDCLISIASRIPVDAGEWAVVLDERRGFAKRADGFVYNLDVGAGREPPFGLTLALKEARDQRRAPSALVLQSMPSGTPAAAPDAALAHQWEAALGLPVRVSAVSTDNMLALVTASKSANLLTGEFAPREAVGKWIGLLRPALIVLALMVSVHVLLTLIDNWRLNGERLALEREMTQVFKAAFPAAQAIIDPPLQMQRNLQQLRAERGLATTDEARGLIAKLTQIIGLLRSDSSPVRSLSIKELKIQSQVATMELIVPPSEPRPLQEKALQYIVGRFPGVTILITPDNDAPLLNVRITMRAGQ